MKIRTINMNHISTYIGIGVMVIFAILSILFNTIEHLFRGITFGLLFIGTMGNGIKLIIIEGDKSFYQLRAIILALFVIILVTFIRIIVTKPTGIDIISIIVQLILFCSNSYIPLSSKENQSMIDHSYKSCRATLNFWCGFLYCNTMH